jgi:acetyl esterase
MVSIFLRIMNMRTMIATLSCLLLCQVSNCVNAVEGEYKTCVMVFKRVGDVELKAYVYFPENHKASDNRAAVVFFFGGGWKGGTPTQFEEHCKYLAARGMVAATVDYRVKTRHGTTADCCVRDAKSAIRWMRSSAGKLGVDPNRIVAAGGSAGGHIAACTGVVSGWEEKGEDLKVSSQPNAMVLFNPALVLADITGEIALGDKLKDLERRMNTNPVNLSPYHQVNRETPPTIIFHGKADDVVHYKTAELYAAKAGAWGRVELHGYAAQQHGFFNFKKNNGEFYKKTVAQMDAFLVSLKYLDP